MKLLMIHALSIFLVSTACTKSSSKSKDDSTSNQGVNSSVIDNSIPSETDLDEVPTSAPIQIAVTALWPNNGSQWFDMVTNDGDIATTSDSACVPASDDFCHNGGAYRKVAISTESSCDNLSLTDSLNLFEWKCVDEGESVYFYSVRFQKGKGLRHAMTETAWRDNHVTLTKSSQAAGESSPSVWWTTPVVAAPSNPLTTDGSATLSTSNQFYTIASDRNSDGYHINGDRIGLVVLDGATLSYSDDSSSNCDDDGEIGPTYRTILCTGGQKYLWIEGRFDLLDSANNAFFYVADFTEHSRLHGVTIFHGGLRTDQMNKSMVTDFTAFGKNYNECALIWNSAKNRFINYRAHDCALGFSMVAGSTRNSINGLTLHNSAGRALSLDAATENTFNDVLITHTNDLSVTFENGGNDNTLSHATVTGGTSQAIFNSDVTGLTVHNTLVSNMTGNGYHQTGTSSSGLIHNFHASESGRAIQVLNGGASVSLNAKGYLGVQIGSPCNINATANSNIDTGVTTCTESDPELVVMGGLNLNLSFPGNVDDDSLNQNTGDLDGSGVLTEGSITDWINFESRFYGWGLASNLIQLNSSNRGDCSFGLNCRIWNWGLKSDDTVVKNYLSETLPCPAVINGTDSVTSIAAIPQVFLAKAQEITRDGIGDEDGLCESNEECIYSPNLGAYQGSGDYKTVECSFTDGGGLTNIKVYAYPND